MKLFLAGLYLLVVMLYTAMTKLAVVLPVRVLALLFLTSLLFLCYPAETRDFHRRHLPIITAIVAFAVIGTVLTYFNLGSVAATLEQLTANVVQPYLIFFCTMVLIRLLGWQLVAMLALSAAALTSLVAILQWAGFEPAWTIRELTFRIQREPPEIEEYVYSRERAIGLSLSPIVFSYHIVCAYFALNVIYRFGHMRALHYYAGLLVVIAAILANGTRSALIGVLVSELLMQLRRREAASLLSVTAIAALGVTIYLLAERLGLRIAEVDDSSAAGRAVLYNFGMLLARDHPLGFGWDFNPNLYAWLYWEHLAEFDKADGIYRLDLHNAFINFFLTYGVAGTFVALLVLLYDPRFVATAAFYLSSYAVHAFFHNNGILIGDYFFWFSFAIMLYVFERHGVSYGAPVRQSPRPVFARQA